MLARHEWLPEQLSTTDDNLRVQGEDWTMDNQVELGRVGVIVRDKTKDPIVFLSVL